MTDAATTKAPGDPEAAEEAGARSFLRAFLALFGAAIVALGGISVALDPTGIFGIRIVPASQQTTRDDKADALLGRPAPPEILVLGSSRAWSIRPARLAERGLGTAFNFGVDNGIVVDFDAIYRFTRAQPGSRVRRLLLAFDVEMLDEHRGGRLDYSRRLRPFSAPGAVTPYWQMLPEFLLGSEVVDSDVRSLKHLIHGDVTTGNRTAVLPKNVFKADGSVTWPKFDDARAKGTFDLDAQINAGISTFRASYASFRVLSPRRIVELRRFLEQAREGGVIVDVYVPPIHPRAYRELAGLAEHQRMVEKLLADLAAAGLARFHADARLADFGGDPEGFYDFQHMTAENGDRLLAKLYAEGAGAPP
jgi:hypothetical protein